MNVILPETVALIKRWELFMPRRYLDKKKGGGAWAIGYGHTEHAGTEPRVITEDMELTEPEAAAILANDLEVFAKTMRNYIKAPVNDHQFGALLSLFYNSSPKRFGRSEPVFWIMQREVKFPYEKAARSFVINSNPEIEPGDGGFPALNTAWDEAKQIYREYLGLTVRRICEAAYFMKPVSTQGD